MGLVINIYLFLQVLLLIYLCLFIMNGQNEELIEELVDDNFNTRILIIIPVHNEENNIVLAIEAVKKANYPHYLRDIVVLADRCTDNTVSIALKENVDVYEEIDNCYFTKGGILESYFEKYMKYLSKYDYICIIDADTVVENDFFIEADREYKLGRKIVQVKVDSKQTNNTMVSAFLSVFQSIRNVIFYDVLYRLNITTILSGKGMLFSPDVFGQLMWNGKSLIEDVDISFQASVLNVPITYSKKTSVACAQPSTVLGMWKQQRRWLSGQYLLIAEYITQLIAGKIAGGTLLFALEGILSLLILPVIFIFITRYPMFLALAFLFYYVNAVILTLISVYVDNRENKTRIRDIIVFPFMMMLWYLIKVFSFLYPSKKWK